VSFFPPQIPHDLKSDFAALENLDDDGDINGACKTVTGNVIISAK
jgi:hypothetical protein